MYAGYVGYVARGHVMYCIEDMAVSVGDLPELVDGPLRARGSRPAT